MEKSVIIREFMEIIEFKQENYEGKKGRGNKRMEAKQKLVKRASVMALATVVGCGIFGCQKKTEPIIPEVSVRVEETLDNDGDTIREVESVIGKERKSYIEESSVAKEEESTEAIPTPTVLSKEEFEKMIKDVSSKTGTDANGHPYLQKGQDYTFKDNGMGEPVEAPRGLKSSAVNPNTGVEYYYLSSESRWIVDTSKQDEELAKQYMDGKVDLQGNPVEKRKMTEEELNKYAKMFSDSFK